MTRYGYDSVSPGSIPANAPVVFGYIDGRYAWSAGDWARFSGVKMRIAVFPSTNDGHILDCEPGDATPAQCPGWVQMRRRAGIDPWVYTSQAEWGQVIDAFNAAGVAHPHYWIAAYPGNGQVQQTLRGFTSIAHQFADPPASGGNYDLSVVADFIPNIDSSNAQEVHVAPGLIFNAAGVAGVNNGQPLFPHGLYHDGAGNYIGLTSDAGRQALVNAGVPQTDADQADAAELLRLSRIGKDTAAPGAPVTLSGATINASVPPYINKWVADDTGDGNTVYTGSVV